jgi:hypothetical protein
MKIALADRSHDSALRALVRSMPMPGSVQLAFAREPSFFGAMQVEGTEHQVIIAQEGERVVGMGCRSIKPVYVNGRPARMGHLGGLRTDPSIRSTTVLARAYAFLRELHRDGGAPAYLSTIVEENNTAMAILTSRRAGLPAYHDLGRYLTHVMPAARVGRPSGPVRVGPAAGLDPDRVVRFLNEQGRRRQFFPVVAGADLGAGRFRGLHLRDILVATVGGAIVGTMGAWDQAAYRQVIVHGYAQPLRALRPVLNPVLRLSGQPVLPPAGLPLRILYASLVAVADDDPDVLASLVRAVCRRASARGHQVVALGLHERDPLRRGLARIPARVYRSRLFCVAWEDGTPFVDALDRGRVPYLEPGAL